MRSMPPAFRALPVLLRICAEMTDSLSSKSDHWPAAAEDAGARLATGNKLKPSDVNEYVALLARHIADAERREAFSSEARACIHV
jgi:hypothetical protein